MATHPRERHNGHQDRTGIEWVRSQIDRRRNWGDLSRLPAEVRGGPAEAVDRAAAQAMAFCFFSGLMLGFWIGRTKIN